MYSLSNKTRILIMITLILLSTSGCWSRKELNNLAIIGAVAIDVKEKGVKLTYEVISPKRYNSASEESPSTYFQSQGESIFDANRNATLKFNKKLFWPHTNIDRKSVV